MNLNSSYTTVPGQHIVYVHLYLIRITMYSYYFLSSVYWMCIILDFLYEIIGMRISEDIIHILFSFYVKGDSNANENTWRHYTCPRFFMPKVIQISMRIPEDIIQVLVSSCWRFLECWWEYPKTSYMTSFHHVEGDSDVDENTW
jgi:hypothetical protein